MQLRKVMKDYVANLELDELENLLEEVLRESVKRCDPGSVVPRVVANVILDEIENEKKES